MTEPSPPRSVLASAAIIGAIVLLLAAAFAWAAGWIGAKRIDGGTLVGALQDNGGTFPGYRRAHAKGLCLAGTFTANGAGSALSRATIFKAGTYPVIGRFSLGGGNPLATDGRPVFHAIAMQLRTPDRQEWRWAMDHTPIFPVADRAAFVALQKATTPDPKTGKPDPVAMKAYLALHPETKAFLDYMATAPLPDSFANAPYYSINAFRFTNAAGQTQLVRWQIVPEAPLTTLDKAKLAALPRDYLFDEMIRRAAHGPSRWHLTLVVANPGDVTDKATIAWTGPHRTIDAGLLTVAEVMPEATGNCLDLNFDPTIVPPGIALSDDPLLAARSKAYATSFTRRAGETRAPGWAATPASEKAR